MNCWTVRIAVVIALFGLAGTVASVDASTARDVQAITLSASERADVARIQEYLNAIRTVRARFTQTSSNGQVAEGELYISRPGRLRIEYDPPVPVLIVSDGTWLIYFDRELQQVSHLPLGSTPADILTKADIALSGDDLTITGFEAKAGLLRVSLVRTKDPLSGRVTLVFNENPVILRQWTIVDAQGVETHVSLDATRFDVPLNPNLFRFEDPRMFKDKF